MDVKNGMFLEQRQLLSQTQIQSLEILAMDSGELKEFLQEEYLENPLLDYSGKSESAGMEALHNTYDYNAPRENRSEEYGEEEDKGKKDIPDQEEESVKTFLMDQLSRNDFTDREWALMEYLIDCLDETGFFTLSEEEVAAETKMPLMTVQGVLERLRHLEPFGIFAEDLKHCLLRQLEVKGLEDTDLWRIVENHLEDVADGKISNISRDMKLSTLEVRQYIEIICQLNPRPMNEFISVHANYIVPDIIFQKDEAGKWKVELNDNWVEDYHMNDYYLRMMNESKDGELASYFKLKLDRVRFIMSSIAQRRQTVQSISEAVLAHEMNFLEGKGFLEPMTMASLAEELHIHTSTVSRAIKGKYIQCPKGTIFMKNLFSGSVAKAVGAMEIKELLKELIAGENKAKPYSDQKLAKLLLDQGIELSRRVIAKYREEMNIPGSFERREPI
ncbi:MAG: RNA polymerase factor sigma-54 [Lachnospiraceae bacterium]|nr:RNA polymerase factor sigma-54 [Lachnospiraceae bacterium]